MWDVTVEQRHPGGRRTINSWERPLAPFELGPVPPERRREVESELPDELPDPESTPDPESSPARPGDAPPNPFAGAASWDEVADIAADELLAWIAGVPRPHSTAFKDWVLSIKAALHRLDFERFRRLVEDLEWGRLGMVNFMPRSDALKALWTQMMQARTTLGTRDGGHQPRRHRDGHAYDKHPTPRRARASTRDDPRHAAVADANLRRNNAIRRQPAHHHVRRQPTPRGEVRQPWHTPLPGSESPDTAAARFAFHPPPLTMSPAALPGRISPASSQFSGSSPTPASGPTRPMVVIDGASSPTPRAYSPTYQPSSHAPSPSPTFSPRSDVFPATQHNAVSPPQPRSFIERLTAPTHPAPSLTAPSQAPARTARSPARNIVYGDVVSPQAPGEFPARLHADMEASRAAGERVLHRQAAAERDAELRVERRAERAALGIGHPSAPQSVGGESWLDREVRAMWGMPGAIVPPECRVPAQQATVPGGEGVDPPRSGWGVHVQPAPAVWPAAGPPPHLRPQMPRVVSRVHQRASSSPPERPVMDMSRTSFWDGRHPSARSPINLNRAPPPLMREAMANDTVNPPRRVKIEPVSPPSKPCSEPEPSVKTEPAPASKKRPASPGEEPPAKRQSTLAPRQGPTPRLARRSPAPPRAVPAPITIPARFEERPPLSPRQRVPSDRARVPSGTRVPSDRAPSGPVPSDKGKRKASGPAPDKGKRKAPAEEPRRSGAPPAPSAGMARRATIIDVGRSADVFQPPQPLAGPSRTESPKRRASSRLEEREAKRQRAEQAEATRKRDESEPQAGAGGRPRRASVKEKLSEFGKAIKNKTTRKRRK
jgi:hypothetical protein